MKKILYLALFLPSFLFADVKVSNLQEQLYPKSTDYMYIVSNSTSMKVSLSSIDGLIKSVLISTVVYTNTAQTISGSKTFSSTQTFNNKVDIFSANVSDSDKSVINDAGVLDVWKDLNDDPADSIATFKYIYDDGLISEYPSFQIDSSSVTSWTPLVVKQGITGEGLVSNSLIDGSSITKQGLLTAGSGVTLTPGAGTLTISATGGGGGTPALGVFLNGVSVSSPTSQINFTSPLVATLGDVSTATISLDGSSVTLQGNTFNAANKLLQLSASNLVENSLIDSSSVTKQGNTFNGANQLLQLTSGGLITNSLVDGSSITKQGLLTAGSNITLTPGAGTLTIAASASGGGFSIYPATNTAYFNAYGLIASSAVFSSTVAIQDNFPLRFYESGSTEFVSFRSSETINYNQQYVLPNSTNVVGSLLSIEAERTDGKRTLKWKPDQRQLNIPVTNPSAGTYLIGKAINAFTIKSLNCIVDPSGSGENTVIQLQECDSDGDNCTDVDAGTDITCGNTNTSDDGSLSNAEIDANDWYALEIVSVSGTVSLLNVTVNYEQQ